jgi:hypothetical protein
MTSSCYLQNSIAVTRVFTVNIASGRSHAEITSTRHGECQHAAQRVWISECDGFLCRLVAKNKQVPPRCQAASLLFSSQSPASRYCTPDIQILASTGNEALQFGSEANTMRLHRHASPLSAVYPLMSSRPTRIKAAKHAICR